MFLPTDLQNIVDDFSRARTQEQFEEMFYEKVGMSMSFGVLEDTIFIEFLKRQFSATMFGFNRLGVILPDCPFEVCKCEELAFCQAVIEIGRFINKF